MNTKIISVPVFAQWADISSSFDVGSWKTKQLNKISVKMSKNVNKICFWALFGLSNNTALDKNVIFCWFWFPHVVQEPTLGEVEN